jgi:hypothetical protein
MFSPPANLHIKQWGFYRIFYCKRIFIGNIVSYIRKIIYYTGKIVSYTGKTVSYTCKIVSPGSKIVSYTCKIKFYCCKIISPNSKIVSYTCKIKFYCCKIVSPTCKIEFYGFLTALGRRFYLVPAILTGGVSKMQSVFFKSAFKKSRHKNLIF